MCSATRSHIRRTRQSRLFAALDIIDAIAVADIEPIPGAVLPDRVLDEPGKSLRKRWIELPGIDALGDGLNDVGAAAGPVASRPYWCFALNRFRIPVRCRKL